VRPDEAEPTGSLRSRVVRGSVVLPTAGVIVLGLVHAATGQSAAAPSDQPLGGGFNAVAMDARDGGVSRDTARVLTPQVLAQARNQSIAQAVSELEAGQQADALKTRTSAMDASAALIGKQSTMLKDRNSFLMPTAGEFGSGFGMRLHPILHYYRMHNGQDIGGTCGQPIWAAQDGKVTKVAPEGYNGGSGHNVRIDGGKVGGAKLETAYLHMDSIVVKVGQKVHKGELLGTVGNTGISTACHLHFSVYENGTAVNPAPYLKK
jgi:murein DD-endopeptidase MepM/ murein hydrolase activator NlpD